MEFLAHYADGITLKESAVLWDKLPQDKPIVSLQLTLPHGGTLTLKQYDYYYFSKVLYSQINAERRTRAEKHAKLIAGVDEKRGIVFELEVDEDSNVVARRFAIETCEIGRSFWRAGLGGM